MTIKRGGASSNGGAYLISRSFKSKGGSGPDWRNCLRNDSCRVLVSFNTRDELEFKFVSETGDLKVERFKIDEISECYNGDLKESNNILVLEVLKGQGAKEELVLNFDREQECRRTMFTCKYFKMRNRLTSSSDSSSDGSASPSPSSKIQDKSNTRKSENVYGLKSLDCSPSSGRSRVEQKDCHHHDEGAKSQRRPEYDLMQVTDNNGVTHMSVESKSDLGEIDGVILYTDVDYDSIDFGTNSSSSEGLEGTPAKPQRRKQTTRRIKGKAPPPPVASLTHTKVAESDAVKSHTVKVDSRLDKTKEATNFSPRTAPPLTKTHLGIGSGYESDREEWRSRSTFSSSAFHSLARPARQALAAYYRLSSMPAVPTMRKPSPRNPKNLQTIDFSKGYHSMHPADYVVLSPLRPVDNKRNTLQDFKKDPQHLQPGQEHRYGKMLFNKDYKRNPLGGSMTYLNISNRLYGLTDKLKEFSTQGQNTKQSNVWKSDKESKGLKPVIKKNTINGSTFGDNSLIEGSKRPVVRTCSNEPPKKVTFSAFATVQVV